MAVAGLSWCMFLGLYLLFAGHLSGSELGSGIALATLAVAWSKVVRRCGKGSFRGWYGHVRPVLKALTKLLPATLRTCGTLVRVAVRGGSPARPTMHSFVQGGSGDPTDRARRATAVLLACLAPDSFVLRLASDRSEVLLHGIAPSSADPDPRWLT